MRTVGVVTVSRSDFGIYRPVLRAIRKCPELELHLFVSGMHLSPEFGLTVREVEDEGFDVGTRIEMLLSSDTPEAISKTMGLGMLGFAQAYSTTRPDILLILGDRFEMWSAAAAAVPFNIAMAHIHGGEVTEGAMDEAIRHSLTKMSHLHFVATDRYSERVIQLGEEPWRVTKTGAPGLDNLHDVRMLDVEQLADRIGMSLSRPPLLVTLHPVTLEHEDTPAHVAGLMEALHDVAFPVVFTYPNADAGGRQIIDAIHRFVSTHDDARVVDSLGMQGYFSLMKHARAMVGNSSSGIIEAASLELPVVNIGNRQRGRVRGHNVVDADHGRQSIVEAIRRATSPKFRAGLTGMDNPYGDGTAAHRIVEVIRTVQLDRRLLLKRFHDLNQAL